MLKFSFKRIAFPLTIFLAVFLCSLPVTAANAEYYVNDYTIEDYDVKVDVGEDHILSVTETIVTDFATHKHGIYRSIPTSATVYWDIDGEMVAHDYRMKIRDISVSDAAGGKDINYESSSGNGVLELKIGSEDETFIGEKIYVIQYSIMLGDDGRSEFDEVYYNLIGNDWDTYINNMTFAVQLPKPFDESQLAFTSGYYGAIDGSNVSYTVEGNTISGKVTDILAPGEGVTMRLALPDGYFLVEDPGLGFGLIAVFLLFFAAALALFFLFGKDKKVYTTVEVSAPEGITPAEAGYIIDGQADVRDVVSLIIYWANKGYLTIESGKKNQFTLYKVKDADENMKSYEQYMFNELFRGRDNVKASDLKYNFHGTIKNVYLDLKDYFSTPATKLYTRSGDIAKGICYLLAGLTVGIMFGKGFSDYFWSLMAGMIAGGIAFALTVVLAGLIGYYAEKCRGRMKTGVVLTSILYVVFILLMMAAAAYLTGQPIAAAVAAVVAAGVGFVGSYAKKRTEQGNRLLGQILGLKRFIKLVEKDKIEMMVEENPALFYDVLPYAYALGITDKWADKFKGLAQPAPSWYSGTDYTMFNTVVFASLLSQNLNSFQSSMTSTPPSSSSSSGGFGGGGFSGGGVGGGGGGSW